ncbi:chromosomal replication initiator protein DnaA [Porcincola intestinalis]|jgi:chromosomal replication initiator protein|uniref:Chromosomal replication initiator protein DnaA n=1 Tax=Porcincola intestinalis TaxID=2606632 RepID=A0A6L5X6E4_9FIRM|nr:chromosomal replication initiator protein DnaA [Porcincola intestinalis]MCI6237761.1 chromosomal replication initiator protein DnaA [Lachnospiraceae bacterium]MCI6698107.1 chromosomal replication initiator protein DnaA [Lachnospiraceae bacterium]MCI6767172.1 chromosomal replication initiator protein DnaA [Lachnospiraceae bacterium]MCI7093640.1 chromosomal replication initiator protein DnaA [Lachnospiraceae bacterium]MDD6440269.1 chromosomal replication initiator protein DnaA [Lachnospiracea
MEVVEEKWADILENVHQEYEVSDVAFKAWLKPLTIFQIEGNTISILVPNGQMAIEYIQKKYTIQLKVAIAEMTGVEYELEYITPEQARENRLRTANQAKKKETEEEIPPKARLALEEAGLNPRYTFDTFVVGENNRFAYAAAVAIAEAPGKVYNPFFIYGGSGLGKTHLMHSIAHHIITTQPDKIVRYVSSEVFTNELISALKNSNNVSMLNAFRHKYRNIDVLLIDDIQFIIGKDATQNEFFHTFNDLFDQSKQIIISSDRPPKEFDALDDRLKNRLAWGLQADVKKPDYETRMAILQKKAETEGYQVDNEVLQYIATNIKSNIRELEGALIKLIAFSRLDHGRPIDIQLAKDALRDLISPEEGQPITADTIIDIVSEHFGITRADILSKKRNAEIAQPRQIVMYLCREMLDLPYKSIGKVLARDHSTVMHGITAVEDEMSQYPDMQRTIDVLKRKINPGG